MSGSRRPGPDAPRRSPPADTTTDLLTWTQVSSFGYGDWATPGVWEYPDFFPLPVDGDEDKVKWVLTLSTGAVRATNGSAAQYFTGEWNGTGLPATVYAPRPTHTRWPRPRRPSRTSRRAASTGRPC